jgi:hypothetical protein
MGGRVEQAHLLQRRVQRFDGEAGVGAPQSRNGQPVGIQQRDLGEELPGTIAWGNVSSKPTFFSGSYNDLADKSEFADVSWEALRTGDRKTPEASMSGGSILVDASMNPNNS